jgi:hypothetical protein
MRYIVGPVVGAVGLLLAVVAIVVYIQRRKISQRTVVFNRDLMSKSPGPSIPPSRSPGPHTPDHSAAGNVNNSSSIIPFFPSARRISIYSSNFTAVGRDQNESAAPIGRNSSSGVEPWLAENWTWHQAPHHQKLPYLSFFRVPQFRELDLSGCHPTPLYLSYCNRQYLLFTVCTTWYYSYRCTAPCFILALALNTP